MRERAGKVSPGQFSESIKNEAVRIFSECNSNKTGRLLEVEFVDFYKKQKISTDQLGGFLPGYDDE